MAFYLLLLVPLGVPIVAVTWKMIARGRGGAPRVGRRRGTGLVDRFAVLHPGMMAWLLDDGRALRMPLTFGNHDLFTYATGSAPPEQVRAMLDYLCDVLDRVPRFVWT
jgi:hypothetical protein